MVQKRRVLSGRAAFETRNGPRTTRTYAGRGPTRTYAGRRTYADSRGKAARGDQTKLKNATGKSNVKFDPDSAYPVNAL
jgi:hypothetical protein